MAVVNYDRAVSYYDATRGYPDGVPDQIRDAILAHVDADMSTQFLELAIGTGLIGVPFLEAGYRYIGADISAQMMAQIAPKLTRQVSPDLLQTNIMQTLPFASQCMDVVLAVRVFHLLDNWQATVDHIQRILKPSGYLLIATSDRSGETSLDDPATVIHSQWDVILDKLGIGKGEIRPGLWLKDEIVIDYLKQSGAQVEQVDLLEYKSLPLSIRMMAERHQKKMYSRDWELPDDIHAQGVKDLDDWLATECDNADEEVQIPMVFRAIVARWRGDLL